MEQVPALEQQARHPEVFNDEVRKPAERAY